MVGDDIDIRLACRRNYVNYLRDAVDLVAFNYPDIEVVDAGTELGPCIYFTRFAVAANTEDHKEWALAAARLNEFIRDVKARLNGYGWEIFDKEARADGNRVYMDVRWVKKVRIPGKRFVSAMDIYELAMPYLKGNTELSMAMVQPLQLTPL
jgi:hypothetical protein